LNQSLFGSATASPGNSAAVDENNADVCVTRPTASTTNELIPKWMRLVYRCLLAYFAQADKFILLEASLKSPANTLHVRSPSGIPGMIIARSLVTRKE
jgi:hypothetical protein